MRDSSGCANALPVSAPKILSLTDDARGNINSLFLSVYILGVIDGTHVRIEAPLDQPESYFNRKKYASIQLQLISDCDAQIIDAFTGVPGSVHDARVFSMSTIRPRLPELCTGGTRFHIRSDGIFREKCFFRKICREKSPWHENTRYSCL